MLGRVFSIEEFSTFDGPGVRTTVFLKGCPLRCEWCHNPEGQSFEQQMIKSPNGCLGCGACLDCGQRLTGVRQIVAQSAAVCPRNLIRPCAIDYTAEELCGRLLKNAALLAGMGGGVTFSGGEPLAQPVFLLECLRLLEGKVHRALQTSGCCSASLFAQVLANVDYVLFDLKIIDDPMHRHYTGVSNAAILGNFATLCGSAVPFCVRMPMIPGVTDTAGNVEAVAGLLHRQGTTQIELLPYHRLTGSKYALAGSVYSPSFDETQLVHTHLEVFEAHGISASVL